MEDLDLNELRQEFFRQKRKELSDLADRIKLNTKSTVNNDLNLVLLGSFLSLLLLNLIIKNVLFIFVYTFAFFSILSIRLNRDHLSLYHGFLSGLLLTLFTVFYVFLSRNYKDLYLNLSSNKVISVNNVLLVLFLLFLDFFLLVNLFVSNRSTVKLFGSSEDKILVMKGQDTLVNTNNLNSYKLINSVELFSFFLGNLLLLSVIYFILNLFSISYILLIMFLLLVLSRWKVKLIDPNYTNSINNTIINNKLLNSNNRNKDNNKLLGNNYKLMSRDSSFGRNRNISYFPLIHSLITFVVLLIVLFILPCTLGEDNVLSLAKYVYLNRFVEKHGIEHFVIVRKVKVLVIFAFFILFLSGSFLILFIVCFFKKSHLLVDVLFTNVHLVFFLNNFHNYRSFLKLLSHCGDHNNCDNCNSCDNNCKPDNSNNNNSYKDNCNNCKLDKNNYNEYKQEEWDKEDRWDVYLYLVDINGRVRRVKVLFRRSFSNFEKVNGFWERIVQGGSGYLFKLRKSSSGFFLRKLRNISSNISIISLTKFLSRDDNRLLNSNKLIIESNLLENEESNLKEVKNDTIISFEDKQASKVTLNNLNLTQLYLFVQRYFLVSYRQKSLYCLLRNNLNNFNYCTTLIFYSSCTDCSHSCDNHCRGSCGDNKLLMDKKCYLLCRSGVANRLHQEYSSLKWKLLEYVYEFNHLLTHLTLNSLNKDSNSNKLTYHLSIPSEYNNSNGYPTNYNDSNCNNYRDKEEEDKPTNYRDNNHEEPEKNDLDVESIIENFYSNLLSTNDNNKDNSNNNSDNNNGDKLDDNNCNNELDDNSNNNKLDDGDKKEENLNYDGSLGNNDNMNKEDNINKELVEKNDKVLKKRKSKYLKKLFSNKMFSSSTHLSNLLNLDELQQRFSNPKPSSPNDSDNKDNKLDDNLNNYREDNTTTTNNEQQEEDNTKDATDRKEEEGERYLFEFVSVEVPKWNRVNFADLSEVNKDKMKKLNIGNHVNHFINNKQTKFTTNKPTNDSSGASHSTHSNLNNSNNTNNYNPNSFNEDNNSNMDNSYKDKEDNELDVDNNPNMDNSYNDKEDKEKVDEIMNDLMKDLNL